MRKTPRLPAFVILVHRFVNRIRDQKTGLESLNAELRQPLAVAHDTSAEGGPLTLVSGKGRLTIAHDKVRFLRAPEEPGFFQITLGSELLLNASANFADTREADFSKAAAFSDLGATAAKISERRTVSDPWWQIWLITLTGTALLCWYYLNRPRKSDDTLTA